MNRIGARLCLKDQPQRLADRFPSNYNDVLRLVCDPAALRAFLNYAATARASVPAG